jgi:Xaa-Pro aminopeptidase
MTDQALPPHDHPGRRDRLRRHLADLGVETLYVTAPPNVAYLSGFTGSAGAVLVTVTGDDVLITDDRYAGRAAVESPDLELLLTRTPVPALLDRTDGRLAFEAVGLTYAGGRDLVTAVAERQREAVATDGLVERLRIRKEPSEIARLRRACELTVAAFHKILDMLTPGTTEREVATALERTMVDLGADGIAFDSIVAAGPDSAIPHHQPTDRVLAPGDLVKLDFGARVGGYHADMTRTVACGDPGDDLREVYAVVRAAQAAGVAAATAGTACEEVDAVARQVIADAGHGDHFSHGIGHGVGLQIHEAPILATAGSASLAPTTAITVEPGVYLPGLGGVRIEDTIVVASDGPPDVLTDAPRELITL